MIDLTKLLAGALFLGFLASLGGDTVPSPKSKWNDDVGKSINDRAQRSISHYNNAVRDCNDMLSRVKSEAELKALEVNFASKHHELDWEREQINKIDVGRIVERVNQVLRQ